MSKRMYCPISNAFLTIFKGTSRKTKVSFLNKFLKLVMYCRLGFIYFILQTETYSSFRKKLLIILFKLFF